MVERRDKPLRIASWIVAVGAIFLTACASLQPPEEPPSVSLVNLSVLDVGLFEQRYGLTLRLQNPNAVPISITGMEYKVRVNDVDFGRGVARQAITVPAYGEAVVDVDFVSNTLSLAQRLRDVTAGMGQGVRLAVTGGVNLAHGASSLPFNFQADIGGRSKP